MNEYDEKKTRREGALNALESAVIDMRSKIEDEEFASFAKSDEAKTIDSKSREVCYRLTLSGGYSNLIFRILKPP